MFKNELIKLVTNKIFLVFGVLLFLVNGVYLYWSMELNIDTYDASPREYNRLLEELSELDDDRKLEVISRRLEEVSQNLEDAILQGDWPSDALYMETELYQELFDELSANSGYSHVIDTILSNADKQMAKMEKGSFSYRQAEKTKQVYYKLTDVNLVFFPKRGLENLLDNPVTDCFNLFFFLIAVFLITLVERQKQLSILPKTTHYGRGKHGWIKAAVLGLTAAVITVLVFLESFFIIDKIYPFQPLNLPIQSVYPYCPLKVSIAGYLGIYLLLKTVFYLFCMSVFYLVGSVCKRTLFVFILLSALIGISAFCYLTIQPTSYLAFLHNLNPITFSQIKALLVRYQCVDLLGYAGNRTVFYVFLWCVLSVLFVFLAVKISAHHDEIDSAPDRTFSLIKGRKGSVNLFFHESYKVFIAQKILFVLLLAALTSYVTYVPETGKGGSFVDVMYHHYSAEVQGKYSEAIDDYIAKNLEAIEEKEAHLQEGEKERWGISKAAFEEMQGYAYYLSGLENSYFIDNRGFVILTGGDWQANRRHVISLILMFAFAIVCYVQSLSIDYQNGEIRIVQSTYGGRKKYLKEKLLIGCMILLALFGIFWIPELMNIIKVFGTDYILAPAYSLQHLYGVGKHISILAYLIFEYAVILMMLAGIMVVSYFVERKIKNGMISILFISAFVEIPLFVVLIMLYG